MESGETEEREEGNGETENGGQGNAGIKDKGVSV